MTVIFYFVADYRGNPAGILMKPAGRTRQELQAWFSGPAGPPALFAGRVLAFDEKAGLIWAG